MPHDVTPNHPPKREAAICIASESDAARICDVLIRSVHEVCAPDYGNDPAILDSWCSNKSPESIAKWIRNPDNFFIVAELVPQGIVGAALYSRTEASIHLCYLVPEGLHRGIGSRLLFSMEAEARRLGHRQITLDSSITAHEFYKLHGYEDNGEPVYWHKVLGFPMRKMIAV